MAIETEVKQNGGQPDASAALNRIGRLKSMFDPAKFDKDVEHMTAEDTNLYRVKDQQREGSSLRADVPHDVGKRPDVGVA